MRLRRKDPGQPRPSRREFFTRPFAVAESAENWQAGETPTPKDPLEGPRRRVALRRRRKAADDTT
jgi:hypothetical protein